MLLTAQAGIPSHKVPSESGQYQVDINQLYLVGGLEHGFFFSIYWE
jgi:hypothetical protein